MGCKAAGVLWLVKREGVVGYFGYWQEVEIKVRGLFVYFSVFGDGCDAARVVGWGLRGGGRASFGVRALREEGAGSVSKLFGVWGWGGCGAGGGGGD